jgi:hypothetical protein
MSTSNRHEMQLQRTFPSGAEEWHCPECNRSVIMHHQPDRGRLKIIVLTPGDELACHHGATGGITLGGVQVHEADAESVPAAKGSTLH